MTPATPDQIAAMDLTAEDLDDIRAVRAFKAKFATATAGAPLPLPNFLQLLMTLLPMILQFLQLLFPPTPTPTPAPGH